MAYLQFEALGLSEIKTDLSVSYVDHNTVQVGFENADDHRYLQTVAGRYGIVYSRAGNGICHQVHLERFGKPGTTLLGSDSHTPTGGGIGQIAIGAGCLDVAVAMVAGGGASVIFADTVCDLGYAKELSNYGEYSGDPSRELTYQYAKTILDLMTRENDPKGKVLLIGGGIANFTDVAKTFAGIIQALTEYKDKLIAGKVRIFVRRGGPNYREGLEKMRRLGTTLGVPIEVYGPETHMFSAAMVWI